MIDEPTEDIDSEPELDDELEEDEDLDEDLVLDDDLAIDDADADADEDEDEVVEPELTRRRSESRKGDEDEDVLDLDEEHHPDDIEDPLDVLLKERTASASLEDDEEEPVEEVEVDDRGDGPTRIVPRQADEFLCKSCFLVRPRALLADEERMFCRDCA